MISKIGVSPVFTSRVKIAGLAYDRGMKDQLNDDLLNSIKMLENNGNNDDVTLVPTSAYGSIIRGHMDMVVTEKTKNGYRGTKVYAPSDKILSAYRDCKEAIATEDDSKVDYLFKIDTNKIKYSDQGWSRDKKSKIHIIPTGPYNLEPGLYSPELKIFAEEIEKNYKDAILTIGPCSDLGLYLITLTRKSKDGKTVSSFVLDSLSSYTSDHRYRNLLKRCKTLSVETMFSDQEYNITVPDKFVDYVI